MITNSTLAALKCALILCLISPTLGAKSGDTLRPDANEPIFPIPVNESFNQDKLTLGSRLFNDKRLSQDSSRSCASCHQLDHGGVDGLNLNPVSHSSAAGVNTSSIFNARFNFRQHWDGSAASLSELLDMTVQRYGDTTTAWDDLLSRFNLDTQLVRQFTTLYQTKKITRDSFTDAMIYYVASLTTPNARFDQYLRGDNNAINAAEKRGYALFKEYGCIYCHQGINVGGNLYQRFGIFSDYLSARGNIQPADFGRMNHTGNVKDAHVFKVPSLRNIALTAPYLHDGQIESLEQVIALMGQTQLGIEIDRNDISLIAKFLNTLTGENSHLVREDNNNATQ